MKSLFRRDPEALAAQGLYLAIVERGRSARLFDAFDVPDTLDGRFEVMTLHVFLVLHRLKGEPEASALAQALFDTYFADLDQSLRQMGAGDTGIAKRIKRMAEGFYGRVRAYERALDGAEPELEVALGRNLYGTAEPSEAVLAAAGAYVREASEILAALDLADLREGRLAFPPLPPGAATGAATGEATGAAMEGDRESA